MEISIDALNRMINSDDTPEMAYNLGLISLKNGNISDAENHFSHAIQLKDSFIDAYIKRAICYERQQRFMSAFEDYSFVFEKTKEISYAIACSHMLQLNQAFDESIAWANKAQAIDINNSEVYLIRGISYFNQGNFLTAFKDFSIALLLSPEDLQVYIQAGNTLGEMSMHSEAIVYFTRGLEKAQSDNEIGMLLYNRAISRNQIGDTDYRSDFQRAAEINFEPAKHILNQINKA